MKKMLQWYLQDRGVSGIKVFFIRKSWIVILIIFLALLNFSMLFIVIHKTGKLEDRITGNEDPDSLTNDDVKTALVKTSNEINILREVLGFPPISVPVLNSFSEKKIEQTDRAYGYEAYYSAFEKLYSDYKKQNHISFLKNHLDSVKGFLDKYEIDTAIKSDDLSVQLIKNGRPYYNVKNDKTREIIEISPFPFEKYFDTDNEQGFLKFIENSIDDIEKKYLESVSAIKNTKTFIESAETKKILAKNKLYAVPVSAGKDDDPVVQLYNLNRETGQTVGEISYSYKNGTITLNDSAFENIDNFKKAISDIENIIDIKTNEEKMVKKSFEDITRMINDTSFKAYLEDKGFYIPAEPREDEDYHYFDIRTIENREVFIGSFAIHKITGTIYLTDFDEVPVSSIKTFGMGTSSGRVNSAGMDSKKKI
jgi:hypothetical protein